MISNEMKGYLKTKAFFIALTTCFHLSFFSYMFFSNKIVNIPLWINILFTSFFILLILSMVKVCSTNPGYVEISEENKREYEILEQLTTNVQQEKSICRKCQISRPKSSHHCSKCKRCVLSMDHHCPW